MRQHFAFKRHKMEPFIKISTVLLQSVAYAYLETPMTKISSKFSEDFVQHVIYPMTVNNVRHL